MHNRIIRNRFRLTTLVGSILVTKNIHVNSINNLFKKSYSITQHPLPTIQAVSCWSIRTPALQPSNNNNYCYLNSIFKMTQSSSVTGYRRSSRLVQKLRQQQNDNIDIDNTNDKDKPQKTKQGKKVKKIVKTRTTSSTTVHDDEHIVDASTTIPTKKKKVATTKCAAVVVPKQHDVLNDTIVSEKEQVTTTTTTSTTKVSKRKRVTKEDTTSNLETTTAAIPEKKRSSSTRDKNIAAVATSAEQETLSSSNEVSNEPMSAINSLPRSREYQLRSGTSTTDSSYQYIIGIDEAGRGPLAGPVVAAAVVLPDYLDSNTTGNNNIELQQLLSNIRLSGIVDSKKITDETIREELYEQIIRLPNIIWAVTIVNANKIDEINILQATLLGMKSATMAVMGFDTTTTATDDCSETTLLQHETSDASYSSDPYYVVMGCRQDGTIISSLKQQQSNNKLNQSNCYALIDGNKIPTNMPCASEYIIKGDSKEYIIAIASIIAKVTRDRLMNQYSILYPEHNFQQHKGYPTAGHMSIIHSIGCITPIHRKTFAPIKYMELDKDGKIISSNNNVSKKKK